MSGKISTDFTILAENLPHIIARFDKEFRYIYINNQIEIETSLPSSYFINKNHSQLNFSQEFIEIWDKNLKSVFETCEPVVFEFIYNHTANTSIYESILIPEKNMLGKVETILAVIKKINSDKNVYYKSELKNSSAKVLVSSGTEISNLDLKDIINVNELQLLMDNFYNLTKITTAIIDLNGNVLVRSGWQNACTKFHRCNTLTYKNCIESDTKLTKDIPEGEFRIYKCKNGMWDLATPIVIGGEHKGNLFIGQFFFDNEQVDIDYFKSQAKQFNFDEQEYINAVKNVPRFSIHAIENAKAFLTVLTNSISQLSLSNLKLTQLLSERNQLLDTLRNSEESLRESEKRFRLALKNAPVAVAVQDLNLKFTWAYNQRTLQPSQIIGKTDFDLFLPEDAAKLVELKRRVIETGQEIREKLWISSNNHRVFLDLYLEPIKDESGKINGIGIATIDLTLAKIAEQQIEHLASFPRLNPNPVIETDLNGEIIYYNEAASDALQSLNVKDSIKLFLPNDILQYIKSINTPDNKKYFTKEVEIDGKIFAESINFSKEENFIRIYAMDITERKLFENQLRKLWRAVEQSPESIIITDKKGNIEYVNPKFTSISGYSISEVIGKKPSLIKSGSTNPETYKKLWSNITSGLEFRGDLLNRKKDGELYWESVNISPVRNQDGEITNFVAVKEEITERKRAEEKLNRLNRTLNALRHSSEAILRATDELNYMQEICKIIIDDCGHKMIWIGFAENDEAKTVRPVVSAGFDQGYLEKLNITWSDSELGRGPTGTAIRTGKPSICNNVLIDKNFKPWRAEAIKRGYASSVVVPLKDDNIIFGAVSIYSGEPNSFSDDEIKLLSELADDLAYGISVLRLRRDHTTTVEELKQHRDNLENLVLKRTGELEKANEILEEAQTVAHIGNWFLDLQNNYLHWSKEVFNIFGLNPESFNPSMDVFLSIIHPDDVKMVEDAFRFSIENKSLYSIEHRIIRPDGEIRIVHERCITHYTADGAPMDSVGIVQDITELVNAEKEIELHKNHLEELVDTRTLQLDLANRQLKDEIEKEKQVELLLQESLDKEKELNELKSNFISTTSHEFRTPLTSILSSMQLVQRYRKKWSDEQLEDQFARVKSTVFNLTKLLDDILTISRADSGRIILNSAKVNLHSFCLEVIEEIKHRTNENHKFIFKYSSDVKEFLLDKKLVHFILINLLSNAFKYSPGGGKVKLLVSSNNKYIQITVSDEGIGIPSEETEYLFKPFYRAKNTGEIEGTGLGLSIVQRAVELHGGKINCVSKLGSGTKFIVKIPLEQK